jgi:hypothetical protein
MVATDTTTPSGSTNLRIDATMVPPECISIFTLSHRLALSKRKLNTGEIGQNILNIITIS